jgi:hypothetical protein
MCTDRYPKTLMNVVLRRSAVLLAIAASLIVWAGPSHAEQNESFGIAPQPEVVSGVHRTSFEIPLETGATYQDSVKVFNLTDQPLDLQLYAADANRSGSSSISVGFPDQHPTGVGSWISLGVTKVSLAPHGEKNITFTVDVKSSEPQPAIGAIVVENTATGLKSDLAERLSVLVRTVPPNSPTTSERFRPFVLRSPWVIVAIAGLLVVIVLVVIGWRRSRRTRDTLVAPGEVEGADHLQEIPVASLPVIRRLGSAAEEDEPDEARPLLDDDLLVEVDEPLFVDEHDEDDLDEVDLPPARQRTAKPMPESAVKPQPVKAAKRKPAARKPVAKRKPAAKPKPVVPRKPKARESNFIPLDDL